MPVVTTLILVGVLFGAGIMILGEMQSANYGTQTVAVVNETMATMKEAGDNLMAFPLRDAVCSVSSCCNSSDGRVVPTANYTATNCKVAYSGASAAGGFNNSVWLCSYSYTWAADTVASNGSMYVAQSTAELAQTWLPVIVIVLIAGIVMAVLLGAFSGGKRV